MMSGTNGSMKVFRASEAASKPLEFAVEVVKLSTGTRQTHKFKVPARLPMKSLETVLGMMDGDMKIRVNAQGLALMYDFIALLIPGPEFDRLKALIDDPDVVVEAEMIADIVGWLIEELTGRPTGRLSSSGDGPLPTSESLTEASSPTAAATSSPSPSPAP